MPAQGQQFAPPGPPQGPPGTPPQGPPPGFGQPVEPVAEEEPEGSGRKRALPWMIATGVAAALAIGAAAWGFTQKSDAQNAAQQSQAEVASLQAQIDEGKQTDAELQKQLDAVKAEYDKVEQRYQTKKKDLKAQTGKLDDLEKQYNQARKDAQAKAATLKDQLTAAQSKAQLASKCAQVLATGMSEIYNAESPDKVMDDVVKEMEKASESCDTIVNTQ